MENILPGIDALKRGGALSLTLLHSTTVIVFKNRDGVAIVAIFFFASFHHKIKNISNKTKSFKFLDETPFEQLKLLK